MRALAFPLPIVVPCLLAVLSACPGAAAVFAAGEAGTTVGRESLPEGWERVELSSGTFVELFDATPGAPVGGPSDVPPGDPSPAPEPAVLFLHAGGTLPLHYRALIAEAAREAGVRVALPKSTQDAGWGYAGDSQAVAESLALLRSTGADPRRVGIAGHAGGGAYAYLQAYLGAGLFSGVFSLGAPFLPIGELIGPYTPPIRMVYGENDLDHSGGGSGRLREQWEALGVDAEVIVLPGRGKNDLTAEEMTDGFLFLKEQRVPDDVTLGTSCDGVSPDVLCLHDGRFAVEVDWTDFSDRHGEAQVALRGERAGLFWFFAPTNWELLVKVLDGCSFNEHFWVFGAATTTVGFRLRVNDLWTGRTAIYDNPRGRSAVAITDNTALSCP